MIPPPVHSTWPYARIKPGKNNSRETTLDDVIRELHQSLVTVGQLQPLGVIDRPEDNLIYGFRRHMAMGLGWDRPVDVMVYPATITPTQILTLNLKENLDRVDLKPPEIYLNWKRLLELNPDWSLSELGAQMNRSAATVTKCMSPSKLIPEAFDAFIQGRFGFEAAYDISRSPNQAESLRIKLGGGNREALQKARKPKADVVRSSSIKCPLPDGNVVTIKGAELSLEEAEEVLEQARKALKDGIKRGYTAKTFNNAMKDMAAN